VAFLLHGLLLTLETADLLFLGGPMPTAKKRLISLLSNHFTSVMQDAIGNSQVMGDLGDALAARLGETDGFQFGDEYSPSSSTPRYWGPLKLLMLTLGQSHDCYTNFQ